MNYEKYMKKCIKLAQKADGKTSPNPLVGCVVLDKNEKEIACGYHHKAGFAHAEVDALSKTDIKSTTGGTLFVNLEPCSHHGKTPPCADLIIKHKIKKVVAAIKDPNPLVAGKGFEKLKKAGIEVEYGILEKEARKLNEVFLKNIEKQACFVAIKTATTLDGKIATCVGDSKWITSPKARDEVQKIRNRYDAIMTTSSTVLKDNPSMTCRMKNGKNPVRIILDRELKTDFNSKIYNNDGTKIYLVADKNIEKSKIACIPKHVELIKCTVNNLKFDLAELFKTLYKQGIKSVLVEAGGKLNGELVDKGLVDKIYQFIAPKILGDESGKNAFEGRNIKEISKAVNYKFEAIADYNPDILVVYCL